MPRLARAPAGALRGNDHERAAHPGCARGVISAGRLPALTSADPDIAALVVAEEQLQADTLRLIPSENYVSAAVLEASGTVLQNKYSEGHQHPAGTRAHRSAEVGVRIAYAPADGVLRR